MAVGFAVAVLASLGQLVLGFYGFWLVWRVLLPVLPTARHPDQHISPFAAPLTDPLAVPLAGCYDCPHGWLCCCCSSQTPPRSRCSAGLAEP